MARAEKDVVIHAPLTRVFEVIRDYEQYPQFLPEIRSVTIVSRDAGICVARFELELIMRISYTLRLVEQPPHSVDWSLVEAKMLTVNDGGWRLRERANGHTHATYGIELKVRGLIPKSVSTRLAGQTLPETLQHFKRRAESAPAG
jgi:ribosome-associated toxin RatA of RatAB toxin-antitoxin module